MLVADHYRLWSGFHAFNNLFLKLSKFHHHNCPVSLTLAYANQLKLYPHWSIILIIDVLDLDLCKSAKAVSSLVNHSDSIKFGHNNRACTCSNKTY